MEHTFRFRQSTLCGKPRATLHRSGAPAKRLAASAFFRVATAQGKGGSEGSSACLLAAARNAIQSPDGGRNVPDARHSTDLDALARVIETLKQRIEHHGGAIGSNEIRTRTALVDPLLNALGWDTTDPAMVIPEYAAGGGVADYALLKVMPDENAPVIAFIEAKRLHEPLESHRAQMLTYANMSGVKYAGLTNGDRWELYEVFKEAPLHERRIVDVSLLHEPAIDCAVQLLPLKWPSLETDRILSSRDARTSLSRALESNATSATIHLLLESGASVGVWNSSGGTPLHYAVQSRSNPAVVEALLDRGANIEARSNEGWTPLHLAAKSSLNPAVVEALLDRGADIEAALDDGWAPLHSAARSNTELAITSLLINRGADIEASTNEGMTPLYAAINSRNIEVVSLLLNRGSNVNVALKQYQTTPLHVAVGKADPANIQFPLGDGKLELSTDTTGETPLQSYLTRAEAVVALLLDHGANVNTTDFFGDTPLHRAVTRNVIALLLERGANINARNRMGETPLHCATGNYEAVEILLDKGADIEAITYRGNTLFHEAVLSNNIEVVRLLLSLGMDIEATNIKGNTVLHEAVLNNNNIEVVRLLLSLGMDIEATNIGGHTALHCAVISRSYFDYPSYDENEHEPGDMFDLLLTHGADLEAKDNNDATPLYLAAGGQAACVVGLLLNQGADVTAVTHDGWTPLHAAASVGDTVETIETIKLLLIHRADCRVLNNDHESAYKIAEEQGLPDEILQLLIT